MPSLGSPVIWYCEAVAERAPLTVITAEYERVNEESNGL